MAWLIGILEKHFLEWILAKGSAWVFSFIAKIKVHAAMKEDNEENMAQAQVVEALRQKVIKLVEAGQEVPPELEKQLREESRRLKFGPT